MPLLAHKKWFVALVAILAIIILYPLGNDNAIHQSIANDLVYHGRLMYVGSWDHNFPGIQLLHVTSIVLFGNSDMGFRLLDLFIQIGACMMLFSFFSRWLKPETAFMAVLFYVFAYLRGSVDLLGQRDVYGALLTVGAYHLLLKRDDSTKTLPLRDLIAPGLLIGLAVLIRPTFGLYACIAIATLPRIRTIKHAAMLLALACVQFSLTIAAYAANGHFSDIYFATIRFNADLYTTFSGRFFDFLASTLYYPVPVVALAILGIWILLRRGGDPHLQSTQARDVQWLWVGTLVLTLALILVQGKYLSYHFAPLYLFCAPLAAIAAEWMLRSLPQRSRLAVFVLLGVIAAYPKKSIANVCRSVFNIPGWEHVSALDAFRTNLSHRPLIGYEDEQAALHYLRLPENRFDRIEIIGFHCILKAHIAGESATRFNQLNSIGYKSDTAKHFDESAFTPYQQSWRREYVDSLKSAHPGFIVVVRTSDSWYLRDPYNDVLRELPGYDRLIHSNYRLDTLIGGYEIYRRNKS